MYSRQTDNGVKDARVPPNYGGSIFGRRDPNIHFTPDRRPPRPTERVRSQEWAEEKTHNEITEKDAPVCEIAAECESCETRDKCEERLQYEERKKHEESDRCEESVQLTEKPHPPTLLSPIGELGTEELLLIALALIIFQSGKQPDLALILLALLFVT